MAHNFESLETLHLSLNTAKEFDSKSNILRALQRNRHLNTSLL